MFLTPRISRTVAIGFAAGAAIALAGLTTTSAAAGVIIAESFTEPNRTGIQGTTVDQSISPVKETWSASDSSIPRTISNQLSVGAQSAGRDAWVDLPNFSFVPTQDFVRLEVSILTTSTLWIQTGFTDTTASGNTNPSVFDDNQLSIRVLDNSWQIVAGTAETIVASGSGTFNSTITEFQLDYYANTNTVNLSVGGTQVVTQASLGAVTPTLDGYAQIRFNPPGGSTFTQNAPRVDDLTIETLPIPEPGSLAMTLAGGLLLACRRRQSKG